MPVITNPPSPQNQHVRNTYTFAAGSTGSVATHTLFTLTGTVLIRMITGVVTQSLTSGGTPTFSIGHANGLTYFTGGAIADATGLTTTNNMIQGTSPLANAALSMKTDVVLSGANIVLVIGTATVTGGTIVFDVFYDAVSDNGALA